MSRGFLSGGLCPGGFCPGVFVLVSVSPLTTVKHVGLVSLHDLNIVFNISCDQFYLQKIKADFSVPTTD